MRKRTNIFLLLLIIAYLVTIFGAGNKSKINGYEIIFSDALQYHSSIMVTVIEEGKTKKIGVEEYIVGRLPGCIDMDCELESLKVQAILLRTQLLKEYKEQGNIEHRKSETYLEVTEMKELWKDDFEENYNRLVHAVLKTKGIFLIYNREIILPAYFKVSGGYTRNGDENLWDEEYPYLQMVECEKDFLSKDYFFEKEITQEDFIRRLGLKNIELIETEIIRDEAGYCKIFTINYKEENKWYEILLQGERIRSILQLPSSCFDLQMKGKNISIKGKGCGHGLGLSQYGANELAKNGLTFMEIITYFYKDIDFDKIE